MPSLTPMLSAGDFWPALAGAVVRVDADVVAVGLADAPTGGDKPAAAARGENGEAATSSVVTNPVATST